MLKGNIRPTVKNSSGNKTDSKNYRPVMNSSNFLKVIEYLLLPHLEKHLPIHENQFAYRPATGCIYIMGLYIIRNYASDYKLLVQAIKHSE